MELGSLLEAVRKEGKIFCERLEKVRSVSCVEGQFARFLGAETIREARKAAGESKIVRKQIIEAFRQGISNLYKLSGVWNHSLSKPFGYPGDFVILELIYDQIPHPATTKAAGAFVDIWTLQTVLARSVKARMDTLKVFLENFAGEWDTTDSKRKILSLASGTAREIRDINPSYLQVLDITLLDKEQRALNFALRCSALHPGFFNLRSIADDALDPKKLSSLKENNPFDLIYSFGLFDYLSDKAILKCISNFLPMLSRNGTFLFCLKDKRHYSQWFYEWFCDWRFFPRTVDDGPRLAEAAGLKVHEMFIIEGNVIGIYVCKRS